MKSNDAMTFGNAIRDRRRELGYTQAYLSEVSGFSVSFISDAERGKPTVELGRVLILANLLGLDCELNVRGKS